MTLEEAIQTAISYETKIRDLYREALDAIKNDISRRIFEMLGDDEQRHLNYLNYQLAQWQKTGHITPEKLESTIPDKSELKVSVERLKKEMAQDHRGLRQQLLTKALKAEIETSHFYEHLVSELPDVGRDLFARFLEIENNHIEAVRFELDYATHSGYWFGVKEFDME